MSAEWDKPGALPRESGELVITLPGAWPETPGPVLWRWRGGGRTERGIADSVGALVGSMRGASTRVYSPAADTFLKSVSLPTRSPSKIVQALPFALEEDLVDDPKALHFAYEKEPGGALAVAVTSRERLGSWLRALRDAGLSPSFVCPATLAAAWEEGTWVVSQGSGQAAVRTGRFSGFAFGSAEDRPPLILEMALREAREKGTAPRRLIVFDPPETFDAQAWSAALCIPVERGRSDLSEGWEDPPLNLLQGPFAQGGGVLGALAPLRRAAIPLALWLAGGLAADLWRWRGLAVEQRERRREMSELFHQAFPEARAAAEPGLQMERNWLALKGRGGQASEVDFLPLLARAAPALRRYPLVRLRALQYDESGLLLSVAAPDFQALEGLRKSLAEGRLRTEMPSAESRGGAVDARLRVAPGGP